MSEARQVTTFDGIASEDLEDKKNVVLVAAK